MHVSYDAKSAREQCHNNCDTGDCKAFLLQDDYRPNPNGEEKKLYFLYNAYEEPSPAQCANDPFNQINPNCSYGTPNAGQFFITPTTKTNLNVKNASA
mmetsp:Transcript_23698/g.35150  ORF Transcript_23698/g.35150 Transcript_23698/m.35150 type:complete len:98 (-) Transcript_23698:19-312(-)